MSLNNKSIIVTGGSRGIGKELVLSFAKQGANVSFTYLNDDIAAVKTKTESENLPGNVKFYKVDVRDYNQVKSFVDEVLNDVSKIDVLVNNSGIRRDKSSLLLSLKDWDDVIATNLTGTFYLSKTVGFHMVKNKRGRIINLSSTSGLSGIAGQTNYSSSKAGVIGFTHALAKELAPYQICVNAVAPGGVDTDMVTTMPERERNNLIAGVPVGRLCKPEEVAMVVRFLADCELSPDYLTGTVISLDGGMGLI